MRKKIVASANEESILVRMGTMGGRMLCVPGARPVLTADGLKPACQITALDIIITEHGGRDPVKFSYLLDYGHTFH